MRRRHVLADSGDRWDWQESSRLRPQGLRANPKEIAELKECFKKYPTAELLFWLNLEMGLREVEALTITTNMVYDPDDPQSSGIIPTTTNLPVYDYDEVSGEKIFTGKMEKINAYRLFIRTRKGDWHGERIHKALILDKFTNSLIEKRLNQIKEGILMRGKMSAEKIQKEYGVDIDLKSDAHCLVGADNEFFQVSTLQNDTPKKTTQQGKNQKILADQFRECYRIVLGESDYWLKKPFHTMRHLFAQYWLFKTSWDVNFVADLGHWKAPTELIRSYGAQPLELFDQKQITYHSEVFLNVEDLVKKMQKKSKAQYEETIHTVEDTYDKEQTQKQEETQQVMKFSPMDQDDKIPEELQKEEIK